MGYVTDEQKKRAREILVLDYVLSNEGSQFKQVGSGYRNKEHPSLAVSEKGFYWHSQGGEIKGVTALDYLTDVRGVHFVEAVCLLIGERPYEKGDKTPTKTITPKARPPTQTETQKTKPPPEKIPFNAPLRNKDNRRVIAYLQSRGIDRDLIIDCINKGSIYESYPYHNAVFTGKDENGKTRFAAMRGTMSNFKCDAEGSDKKYGFIIPPENPNSREVAIFEAPIDCLSHQTLCKQGFIEPFDGWRLSLGCTALAAFVHFREVYPEVNHCIICTDNDDAGNKTAAKIMEMPDITARRSFADGCNDWNDMLQALQKTERTENRARSGDTQII